MNFCVKFEVVLQKQFSVTHCKSLEIRLSYCKLNSRKLGNSLRVFHRNSLKYTNDQRGKINWNWLIFLVKIVHREKPGETQDNMSLQRHLETTKETPTALKHPFEFTCSDFPRHRKVNRDKLVWINRWLKCKKGKGWWLPLVYSWKLTNMSISPAISHHYHDWSEKGKYGLCWEPIRLR